MLPAGSLSGRVAIITGGGTGLGKAIAAKFASLGAQVVLASRNQANLEEAAAQIAAAGGEALVVPMDVRNPEDVDRTVAATLERFGQIDILVNNAAGNFICPAEQLSINGWNAVINIVLNGTFYMSRAVGRYLIGAGRGGSILNIVSTYAWTAGPGTIHSACAKAGVLAMTRTLAVEWGRYGIRTNAIAPGPVGGTGAAERLFPTEEDVARLRRRVPLGRLGEAEEIANAAAFLVSDYAAYINGDCLTVDGGLWLNNARFGPFANT